MMKDVPDGSVAMGCGRVLYAAFIGVQQIECRTTFRLRWNMRSLLRLLKDIPVIGSWIDWMALKKRGMYRRYLLLRANSDDVICFRCNICGCRTSFPRPHLSRE